MWTVGVEALEALAATSRSLVAASSSARAALSGRSERGYGRVVRPRFMSLTARTLRPQRTPTEATDRPASAARHRT